MAEYIVSGHGGMINNQAINILNNIVIYTYNACGTNISVGDSTRVTKDLENGWTPHRVKYHDQTIQLCTHHVGNNNNELVIFISGLFSRVNYNKKQQTPLFKTRLKDLGGDFVINRFEILSLYDGAIYPTLDMINQLFIDVAKKNRKIPLNADHMHFHDFVNSRLIQTTISEIELMIPAGSKLYVSACRGFDPNDFRITQEHIDDRLDSSDDFDYINGPKTLEDKNFERLEKKIASASARKKKKELQNSNSKHIGGNKKRKTNKRRKTNKKRRR